MYDITLEARPLEQAPMRTTPAAISGGKDNRGRERIKLGDAVIPPGGDVRVILRMASAAVATRPGREDDGVDRFT
jgi:hypothetical protein